MAFGFGDRITVRLFSQAGDQAAINVLWYRCSAADNPGPTNGEAALVFETKFAIALRNCMSPAATFRGAGVQNRYVIDAEQYSSASQGPGLGTGDNLPRQVSGVITLKTNTAQRRARGRKYIGFPAESDNDANGRPQAAYVTRLQTLANLMDDSVVVAGALGSATFVPIVWSRKFAASFDITSCLAREKWGTQRRRGDYGRPNVLPV